MKERKIAKRYMYFCKTCGYLSFYANRCEECGEENMEETPRRYGLTNLACISMAVMDFEALKKEFVTDFNTGFCTSPQSL